MILIIESKGNRVSGPKQQKRQISMMMVRNLRPLIAKIQFFSRSVEVSNEAITPELALTLTMRHGRTKHLITMPFDMVIVLYLIYK